MARTDTLPHFLTDVADAIRTKGGTSEQIQASSFDTAIANLPSGGGTPTPTSLASFTEILSDVLSNFNTYLDELPTTYSTYTDSPVTLYTPNADYKYYIVQKRAGGKYRVDWMTENSFIFQAGGSTVISYINWSISTVMNKSLNSLVTSGQNALLTNEGNYNFYYSQECSSLSDCLTKFLNNQLTYTYVASSALGTYTDTPYLVPYSNAVVFRVELPTDKNGVIVETQRISQNETITTI